MCLHRCGLAHTHLGPGTSCAMTVFAGHQASWDVLLPFPPWDQQLPLLCLPTSCCLASECLHLGPPGAHSDTHSVAYSPCSMLPVLLGHTLRASCLPACALPSPSHFKLPPQQWISIAEVPGQPGACDVFRIISNSKLTSKW